MEGKIEYKNYRIWGNNKKLEVKLKMSTDEPVTVELYTELKISVEF